MIAIVVVERETARGGSAKTNRYNLVLVDRIEVLLGQHTLCHCLIAGAEMTGRKHTHAQMYHRGIIPQDNGEFRNAYLAEGN
jgi:hypothetical protein